LSTDIDILYSVGLTVSAAGNHEFDEGYDGLLRMQRGCHPVDRCEGDDEVNPVCDVAIEYAHCRIGGGGAYDDPRGLVISAQYAKQLRETLTECGLTTTVQVLVDDKSVSPDENAEESLEALLKDCERELRPDGVVLESGLGDLLEPFLANTLHATDSHRIGRAITRYRERHGGKLACSHDIALWHTLRLGRLDPRRLLVSRTLLGPTLMGELRPSRVVVSVLPRHDAKAEKTADRKFLNHVTSIDPANQVLRYYFPDDVRDARVRSAEWADFVRTVIHRGEVGGIERGLFLERVRRRALLQTQLFLTA
jgi:hypothetical protein